MTIADPLHVGRELLAVRARGLCRGDELVPWEGDGPIVAGCLLHELERVAVTYADGTIEQLPADELLLVSRDRLPSLAGSL